MGQDLRDVRALLEPRLAGVDQHAPAGRRCRRGTGTGRCGRACSSTIAGSPPPQWTWSGRSVASRDLEHAAQQAVAHRLRVLARLRPAGVAPAHEGGVGVAAARRPHVEAGAVGEIDLNATASLGRRPLGRGRERVLELVEARRVVAQRGDRTARCGTTRCTGSAGLLRNSARRDRRLRVALVARSGRRRRVLPEAVQVAGGIGRVAPRGGRPPTASRVGVAAEVARRAGGASARRAASRRSAAQATRRRRGSTQPGRDEAHPHHRDAVEEAARLERRAAPPCASRGSGRRRRAARPG